MRISSSVETRTLTRPDNIVQPGREEPRRTISTISTISPAKLNYLSHFPPKLLSGTWERWTVPGWFVWLFFYKWYSPCIIELKLGFISQVIVSYIYHNQNNNSPSPQPETPYFSSHAIYCDYRPHRLRQPGLPSVITRLRAQRDQRETERAQKNSLQKEFIIILLNDRDQSSVKNTRFIIINYNDN